MIAEAQDFQDESQALCDLIMGAENLDWEAATQFKGWTLTHVLRHLHFWNVAAHNSLVDEAAFDRQLEAMQGAMKGDVTLPQVEERELDGLSGEPLLAAWRDGFAAAAEDFGTADPKARLKWAGPSMSARSSITARLMETWAHGQEVYDSLGVVRQNGDRIKSICVLGMNTFGWTYANRKLDVPAEVPHVALTAPSGDVWEWNAPNDHNCVRGSAESFCQVVTQVRNIADVDLQVSGDVATEWMSIAQCFAGAPNDPPAPGTRFTATH